MSLLKIIKQINKVYYKNIDLNEEKLNKLIEKLENENIIYKVIIDNEKIDGIEVFGKNNFKKLKEFLKEVE